MYCACCGGYPNFNLRMEKVRSPQFSGVRVCAESATDLTAGGCARIHDSNSFFFSSKPPNIFAVRLVFCVAECCSRARSSHCAGCVLQNNERKNTIRASNLYERIWKKYCTVLRNLTVKGDPVPYGVEPLSILDYQSIGGRNSGVGNASA